MVLRAPCFLPVQKAPNMFVQNAWQESHAVTGTINMYLPHILSAVRLLRCEAYAL